MDVAATLASLGNIRSSVVLTEYERKMLKLRYALCPISIAFLLCIEDAIVLRAHAVCKLFDFYFLFIITRPRIRTLTFISELGCYHLNCNFIGLLY